MTRTVLPSGFSGKYGHVEREYWSKEKISFFFHEMKLDGTTRFMDVTNTSWYLPSDIRFGRRFVQYIGQMFTFLKD